MNCEKIKEILLTDYLDNQLNKSRLDTITKHLEICPKCAAFALEAKKYAFKPFENLQQSEVPSYIWENIKIAIKPTTQHQAYSNHLDRLFKLLSLPRSIFTLSSAMAIVLIGLFLLKSPQFFIQIKNRQLAIEYLNEQSNYIEYDKNITYDLDSFSLGTDIEEYLL